MPRRRAHAPLDVLINNRPVGRLLKEPSGAISFRYGQEWLEWEHGFAVSLSLPLRETPYSGAPVAAVFDNLLPDNEGVRRKVAERTGAAGTDAYSLLERIGRDCVGAMQFVPEGEAVTAAPGIRGETVSDAEIEQILANLGRAPLGLDREHDFRISVAGAQEKTALLFHEGRWMRPIGTTPTTHILKPQLGEIPTAFGTIDMAASVDNEHYCLAFLHGFGLPVARSEIVTFGRRRVLAVERFDRRWRDGSQLLRLPQEDCCQALGYPPSQKYQSDGGPGAVAILKLLQRADTPIEDQALFFKSQILFWLMGATDGHAKNFSLFLRPEGRYGLTPFYDVLSAQPAFDRRQVPHRAYRLAMSAGRSRPYRIVDITGRHFVETGREAGLGPTIIRQVIDEILGAAETAPDEARARMPGDFSSNVHESIQGAMRLRIQSLEQGLAEL
jgi:serine/threonine-protein kinase HipA